MKYEFTELKTVSLCLQYLY